MKNITVGILLLIWQLPQIIIGSVYFIFLLISKKVNDVVFDEERIIIVADMPGAGLSLANFIFVTSVGEKLIKHERGHSIQSKYLGPIWLLVIGLPSIVWCTLSIYNSKIYSNYYKFYTEKWADHLGGVDRR